MAKTPTCRHGANPVFCSFGCTPESRPQQKPVVALRTRTGEYGFHGGETKQDVINEICDLLGIPHRSVSVGSSLPADVFRAAAKRVGVTYLNMPDACERIVKRAGLVWDAEFDSRGTISGGGSTVTLEGVQALREALRKLVR